MAQDAFGGGVAGAGKALGREVRDRMSVSGVWHTVDVRSNWCPQNMNNNVSKPK